MNRLCENCLLHVFYYCPSHQWLRIHTRTRKIVQKFAQTAWNKITATHKRYFKHDKFRNFYKIWLCKVNSEPNSSIYLCQDKTLRQWYRNDWILRRILFSTTRTPAPFGCLSLDSPVNTWIKTPPSTRISALAWPSAVSWPSKKHVLHDTSTGRTGVFYDCPASVCVKQLRLPPSVPCLTVPFGFGLFVLEQAKIMSEYLRCPEKHSMPDITFPVYTRCNGCHLRLFDVSSKEFKFLLTRFWQSLVAIDLLEVITERLRSRNLLQFFSRCKLKKPDILIHIEENSAVVQNCTLAERSLRESISLSFSDIFSLGITRTKILVVKHKQLTHETLPYFVTRPLVHSLPDISLCLGASLGINPRRHPGHKLLSRCAQDVWNRASIELPRVFQNQVRRTPFSNASVELLAEMLKTEMYTPHKHLSLVRLLRLAGTGIYSASGPVPDPRWWTDQLRTLTLYAIRFATLKLMTRINGEDVVQKLDVGFDGKGTRLRCTGRLHPDLRIYHATLSRLVSLLWCSCARWMLEPCGPSILEKPESMNRVVEYMRSGGRGLCLSGNRMVQKFRRGRLVDILTGQTIERPLAHPLRRVRRLRHVHNMKPRRIEGPVFCLCTLFNNL